MQKRQFNWKREGNGSKKANESEMDQIKKAFQTLETEKKRNRTKKANETQNEQ